MDFSILLEWLLVRTLLLTLVTAAAGLLLTVTQCHSWRIHRFAWGIVLLVGVVGASIPINFTAANSPFAKLPSWLRIYDSPSESIVVSDSTVVLEPMVVLNENSFSDHSDLKLRASSAIPLMEATEELGLISEPVFPIEEPISERSDTTKSWSFDDVVRGIGILWLCGLVLFLLSGVFLYRRVLQNLCHSLPASGIYLDEWNKTLADLKISPRDRLSLRISNNTGPALVRYSWNRFCVVVPKEFWEDAVPEVRRGVLRHELGHWLAGDLLKSFLARLVLGIHWFNPLAHLAFQRWEEAAEWRCDVLAFGDNPDGVKCFAQSILTLYESSCSSAIFQAPFGRNNLLRRCSQLKNYQQGKKENKMKKTIVIISLLILACIALTRIQIMADGTADSTLSKAVKAEKSTEMTELVPEVDTSVILTGSVLDGITGKPIKNATIQWMVSKNRSEESKTVDKKTLTDDNGKYNIPLPDQKRPKDDWLHVFVTAPGYIGIGHGQDLFWTRRNVEKGNVDNNYHFKLYPEKILTGILRAEDNSILVNPVIEVVRSLDTQGNQWGENTDNSFCIPDGLNELHRGRLEMAEDKKSARFEIAIFQNGPARITFSADNAAPLEIYREEWNTDPGTISLSPGFRPSVTLLDSKGKPMPDVSLCVRQEILKEDKSKYASCAKRYGKTSVNGRAEFLPIMKGSFDIRTVDKEGRPYMPITTNNEIFANYYTVNLTSENPNITIQSVPTGSITLRFNVPVTVPDKNNFMGIPCILSGILSNNVFDKTPYSVNADNVEISWPDKPKASADGFTVVEEWKLSGIPLNMKKVKMDLRMIVGDFDRETRYRVKFRRSGKEQIFWGRTEELVIFPTKENIWDIKDGDIWDVEVIRPASVKIQLLDEEGKSIERFAASVLYFPNPGHGELKRYIELGENREEWQLSKIGLERFHTAMTSGKKQRLLDTFYKADNLRSGIYTLDDLQPERSMYLFVATEDGRQYKFNPDEIKPLKFYEGEEREIVIHLKSKEVGKKSVQLPEAKKERIAQEVAALRGARQGEVFIIEINKKVKDYTPTSDFNPKIENMMNGDEKQAKWPDMVYALFYQVIASGEPKMLDKFQPFLWEPIPKSHYTAILDQRDSFRKDMLEMTILRRIYYGDKIMVVARRKTEDRFVSAWFEFDTHKRFYRMRNQDWFDSEDEAMAEMGRLVLADQVKFDNKKSLVQKNREVVVTKVNKRIGDYPKDLSVARTPDEAMVLMRRIFTSGDIETLKKLGSVTVPGPSGKQEETSEQMVKLLAELPEPFRKAVGNSMIYEFWTYRDTACLCAELDSNGKWDPWDYRVFKFDKASNRWLWERAPMDRFLTRQQVLDQIVTRLAMEIELAEENTVKSKEKSDVSTPVK